MKFSTYGGEPYDFDTLAASVGPGWKPLLRNLVTKLSRLGWDGSISQVKEKYGTLRFNFNNNIQDLTLASVAEDVVAQAEWYSGTVCETCGNPGRVRGESWVVTRCDACYAQER